MTETVKELIVKIKQEIKLCNSALALKTLEDLINKYENKLAKKDRKIDQQQLYKEDFYKNPYSTGSINWILVESSKYDKLPSKEDK